MDMDHTKEVTDPSVSESLQPRWTNPVMAQIAAQPIHNLMIDPALFATGDVTAANPDVVGPVVSLALEVAKPEIVAQEPAPISDSLRASNPLPRIVEVSEPEGTKIGYAGLPWMDIPQEETPELQHTNLGNVDLDKLSELARSDISDGLEDYSDVEKQAPSSLKPVVAAVPETISEQVEEFLGTNTETEDAAMPEAPAANVPNVFLYSNPFAGDDVFGSPPSPQEAQAGAQVSEKPAKESKEEQTPVPQRKRGRPRKSESSSKKPRVSTEEEQRVPMQLQGAEGSPELGATGRPKRTCVLQKISASGGKPKVSPKGKGKAQLDTEEAPMPYKAPVSILQAEIEELDAMYQSEETEYQDEVSDFEPEEVPVSKGRRRRSTQKGTGTAPVTPAPRAPRAPRSRRSTTNKATPLGEVSLNTDEPAPIRPHTLSPISAALQKYRVSPFAPNRIPVSNANPPFTQASHNILRDMMNAYKTQRPTEQPTWSIIAEWYNMLIVEFNRPSDPTRLPAELQDEAAHMLSSGVWLPPAPTRRAHNCFGALVTADWRVYPSLTLGHAPCMIAPAEISDDEGDDGIPPDHRWVQFTANESTCLIGMYFQHIRHRPGQPLQWRVIKRAYNEWAKGEPEARTRMIRELKREWIGLYPEVYKKMKEGVFPTAEDHPSDPKRERLINMGMASVNAFTKKVEKGWREKFSDKLNYSSE
ncbi:hypothetical protein EDC01DRAFT_777091 [Geopyxis carbonaria]|nr:hypothetical protein EDC01DRAFT_777091 [Geopyxis carbonaria]